MNENTEQVIIYTEIFFKAWLIKTSWIYFRLPSSKGERNYRFGNFL